VRSIVSFVASAAKSRLGTAEEVRRRLKECADPEKAEFLPRFFKTGPGEYGEGDRFHGVVVPQCRKIARAARDLSSTELVKLLRSPMHEEREVALFIMVEAFKRARPKARQAIYRCYVQNSKWVNNWDLVDASAPTILGGYLRDRDRSQLREWASSGDLWHRRMAVLATFLYIKEGDFEDALAIARLLRDDEEDLIHKAVGWMLREIGNRDRAVVMRFLKAHYKKMPRTMLRYAIEKFPESRRKAYLEGRI
jgi:3-methyladenine DNA glycosylase AlkD